MSKEKIRMASYKEQVKSKAERIKFKIEFAMLMIACNRHEEAAYSIEDVMTLCNDLIEEEN
jgi:hypothetical protein